MNGINIGTLNFGNIAKATKTPANTDNPMQAGLAELFSLMLGIQTNETETETEAEVINGRPAEKNEPELSDIAEMPEVEDENLNLLAYSLPIIYKAIELPEHKQNISQAVETTPEQVESLKELTLILDEKIEQQDTAFAETKAKPDFKVAFEKASETFVENKKTQPETYEKLSKIDVEPKQEIQTVIHKAQEIKPQQALMKEKKQVQKLENEAHQKNNFQVINNQPMITETEAEAVEYTTDIDRLPKEAANIIESAIKKAPVQDIPSITIKLKPDGLGKVVINLKKSSEKLEVVLTTEHNETNKLIKTKLNELKNELSSNITAKQTVTTVVLEASQSSSLANNSGNTSFGTFENHQRSFTDSKENKTNFDPDKNIKTADNNTSTKNATVAYKKGKYDLRI